MTVYRLSRALGFPPPAEAEPNGLLAVGGDLSPERLLLAYSQGIFPWYERPPILWFSPDPRCVLPRGALHVSRRTLRRLRQGRLRLTLDTAFREVMEGCARAPRSEGRTWITRDMLRAYGALHERGLAHSCEVWRDDDLVGGVYGVSLGRAFFGESMFHRETDASKCALAALVWQLEAWGCELFDCQVRNEHMASLGAVEVPRADYLRALERALAHPTRSGRWRLEPDLVASRAAGGA
jgi:leucyl/phenylalanyl-tRNA--protein transferase